MKRFFPFVAAVALLVGLVAMLPAGGQAQTKIKLTQPVDSLTFFPVYVGRNQGFFKAEGIDLKVIATAGGGPRPLAGCGAQPRGGSRSIPIPFWRFAPRRK